MVDNQSTSIYITVSLPASPPANCEFTFTPGAFGFYLNFNGQYALLPGFNGHVTRWTIPVVTVFRTNNPSVSLQYDGANWVQSDISSSHYQATVQPTNAAQLAHGQVYFKWNSSASQFELCPQDGLGGLIVDSAMRQVAIDCLTLAQGGTTSTNLNYFYAVHTPDDVLTVNNVSDDGSGNIRLGFSGSAPVQGNVGDKVAITCFSVDRIIEANVNDAGQIHSSTEIDLLHTAFPGPGPTSSTGTCEIVRLTATTTGHETFDNGVEIMQTPDGVHYTLVGIAYIGSSNAVNDSATKRDVASWFNRRAKTCVNNYTADRTWTSTTAWGEPSQEIRCEFVVFDDPHENAKPWSIAGMFGNSGGITGGTLVGASIDASASVPLTEIVGEKGQSMPLALRGAVSGLAEGKHFISLYAKTLSSGTSTITGVTPATSLQIELWQ